MIASFVTCAAMAEDCESMLVKIDDFIARTKFAPQAYGEIKAARDRAFKSHSIGENAQCIEEATNLYRLLGLDEGAGKKR